MYSTAGYRLIVITNQSGVAQGYFPESALVTVEEESASYWQKWVQLAGFYYPPPPGWCGSELRDRLLLSKPRRSFD